MKEIRLCFYKSTRKNSEHFIKSYCVYNGFKNGKSQFAMNMDFYDAVNRLNIYQFKYVSVAATDYNSGRFFSSNDTTKSNMLDIPESRRFNLADKNDLIELIKLIYHYMILFGSDFDYNYNPFTDSNVIFHIGDLTK